LRGGSDFDTSYTSAVNLLLQARGGDFRMISVSTGDNLAAS